MRDGARDPASGLSIGGRKAVAVRIASNLPGRLRLVLPATDVRAPHALQALDAAVSAVPGARAPQVRPSSGSVILSYDPSRATGDSVVAALRDEGVAVEMPVPRSPADAPGVAGALPDVARRLARSAPSEEVSFSRMATVPIGLALLSLRQLVRYGVQLEHAPWYVFAWYAFSTRDSLRPQHRDKAAGAPLPPQA